MLCCASARVRAGAHCSAARRHGCGQVLIALPRVGMGAGSCVHLTGFFFVPGRCSQCRVCSHWSAYSDTGLRVISFGKAVGGPLSALREPPGQGTLPGLVVEPLGGPLNPVGCPLEWALSHLQALCCPPCFCPKARPALPFLAEGRLGVKLA